MNLKTEFLKSLFVLFVRNPLNICNQQIHLCAAYLLVNDHFLVKSVKHMLLTWVPDAKKGKLVPLYAMQA